MYPFNLSGIIEIPQFGAEFYTLAGEAKTLAIVLLAPGDGLSRNHHRLAEAHPLVMCSILGDPEGGAAPLPEQFHQVTLRWALCNADKIAIWSAPFPQRGDDVARWGIDVANAGAHFVTTIQTSEERAAEWVALIERWKRKATPVQIFGFETTGGVQ